MKNEKKIAFATGMFRSGTTLLARALNVHENISFASDPFFEFFKYVRSKYYSKIKSNFDWKSPLSDKFLEDNDFTSAFLHSFHSIVLNNSDLDNLKNTIARASEPFSPQIIPLLERVRSNGKAGDILTDLVALIPIAYFKKNIRVIGFKEVWTEEFIQPLINRGFYVLHIIRDPRAVVASNKRASSGRYPLLFLIRQWRKSVAFSIINQQSKRYFAIIFEDLIKNPGKNFREICAFLKVPFCEKFLNPRLFKDGAGDQWMQNSSFAKKKKFNNDAVDRWKKVLSQSETRLIEFLCGPEMRYVGYRPIYKDESLNNLNNLFAYQDNKDALAPWIRRYNYEVTNERINEEITRIFLLNNRQFHWGDDCIKRFFISKDVYKKLSSSISL